MTGLLSVDRMVANKLLIFTPKAIAMVVECVLLQIQALLLIFCKVWFGRKPMKYNREVKSASISK
ncbi:hypothetical protein CMI37_39470 [Candidatus Pacearchaeota archaeon]|nr:hypothetical protein [Candidatus Pacearchaeota archaeon]